MGSIDVGTEPVMDGIETTYGIEDHPLGEARNLKLICIGAGASGLNLVYQTRKHLKNVDLTVYEKNGTLGGTWFENTYPGVRCDIPSHIYQFTWAPNPRWSEFYASGPEIQQYLEATARNHDLEKPIKLNHLVKMAQWHEDTGIWKLKIQDQISGNEFEDWCHFLINGSGFLNHWTWPDIAGLHSFKGALLHSAHWDLNVELDNKTIAIIGNGASGIQLVTALQPSKSQYNPIVISYAYDKTEAQHLTNFVRNPTWVSTSYALKFAGPNGDNFSCTVLVSPDFFSS